MILNIKDRIILLQLLPTQGSLSEMVDIMDLAKKIKLDDNTKKLISYVEDKNGNISWNIDKDPNIEVELTSEITNILTKAHVDELISDLDKDKKITAQMLDLALKISKL